MHADRTGRGNANWGKTRFQSRGSIEANVTQEQLWRLLAQSYERRYRTDGCSITRYAPKQSTLLPAITAAAANSWRRQVMAGARPV